jgi:hypothetical protein
MSSFYSLGDRPNALPQTGKPGDVYFWKSETYLAVADGSLVKTSQLITAIAALGLERLCGPQGEPGKDGADSTVPGPRGERGEKGDRGEKGEPGDVLYVGGPEIEQAAQHLREQKAHILAKINEQLASMDHLPMPVRKLIEAHLGQIKQVLR